MCVRVGGCHTNVGQAVINSGLAMTSQTVNSKFSLYFLYTVEEIIHPLSFRE